MWKTPKSDPLPTPGPALESILRLIPVRSHETRILKENRAGSLMEWTPGGEARPLHFQLDAMGTDLYKRINGRRRIEAYVEAFAREHALTFLESSGLWVAYIRLLTRRNILELKDPESSAPPEMP